MIETLLVKLPRQMVHHNTHETLARVSTHKIIPLVHLDEQHNDVEPRNAGIDVRDGVGKFGLVLRGIQVGRDVESVEGHFMSCEMRVAELVGARRRSLYTRRV